MKYETCNEGMNVCCTPEPIESLTDMIKNTNHIANDVLRTVYRINSHLFGIGSPCCEKKEEPKCFRDEVARTRSNLIEAMDELAKISEQLGV